MLAKQFWRIGQNPRSLISKTFKAKYFPSSSIHDCVPKLHHSWFWRSIINHKNSLLKEGRWIVSNAANIPITHTAWFPCQPQTLRQHNLSNGSVADLIDSTTHTWKPGLVRSLYPYPASSDFWDFEFANIKDWYRIRPISLEILLFRWLPSEESLQSDFQGKCAPYLESVVSDLESSSPF